MRMTDRGKDLLRKFDELEKETEAFVEFAYQKLAFPPLQKKEVGRVERCGVSLHLPVIQKD